jgi:hypothetical protein
MTRAVFSNKIINDAHIRQIFNERFVYTRQTPDRLTEISLVRLLQFYDPSQDFDPELNSYLQTNMRNNLVDTIILLF